MMKLILLCLVVAIVFAKPKGSIKLADPAKDVAQKETDKAVEEARHADAMRWGRRWTGDKKEFKTRDKSFIRATD